MHNNMKPKSSQRLVDFTTLVAMGIKPTLQGPWTTLLGQLVSMQATAPMKKVHKLRWSELKNKVVWSSGP